MSFGRVADVRPAVGRFLSLDPRPGGQTGPSEGSYVYALNNPTGWIDPSGLTASAVWEYARTRGSRVLDRIGELLAQLKNGFCSKSGLIATAAASIPTGLFGFWLMGFLTTCTKYVQQLAGKIATVAETIAEKTSSAISWASDQISANSPIIAAMAGSCGFVALFGHGAVSTAIGSASLKYLGRSILLSTPTASIVACGLGAAGALVGIRNP